jgi:hypothetical protein
MQSDPITALLNRCRVEGDRFDEVKLRREIEEYATQEYHRGGEEGFSAAARDADRSY